MINMTTLTLELPTNLYENLLAESKRLGQPLSKLAQTWLTERLSTPPVPPTERERCTQALRQAGLLTELGPTMTRYANQCTVTLEEIRGTLDRTAGQPLSEIILEQRGPKR